jgi:hypothetical protein
LSKEQLDAATARSIAKQGAGDLEVARKLLKSIMDELRKNPK